MSAPDISRHALEAMVSTLTATGDYRILRRLMPPAPSPPDGAGGRRAGLHPSEWSHHAASSQIFQRLLTALSHRARASECLS